MKTNTFSSRLTMLVAGVLDALVPAEQTARKASPHGGVNRSQRKEIYYYMQVFDADTKESVGHLADISTGGFKLDSRDPVPVNRNFRLLMNLPGEIASKPYLVFGARSKWCRADPLDPCAYCVGYQLIQIVPGDLDIIIRMMEKYGRDCEKKNVDLRRSYKW